MKCPNCGNEITGKFCTSCGTPAPVEEPVKEQETQTQSAPQPYQYNSSANQPNGMPVNNGYTGQQFTNVPNNNMPNQPKKGMSGGKVAAIVISVILGIIIILAVVFGIVACNVFKTVGSVIGGVKEGVSIFVEDNESKYNSDSRLRAVKEIMTVQAIFTIRRLTTAAKLKSQAIIIWTHLTKHLPIRILKSEFRTKLTASL